MYERTNAQDLEHDLEGDLERNLDKVRAIVARVSRTPITDVDANLIDLGVQSIDMMRIVGTVENEFAVEFDETHLTRENFATVRSICAVIHRARRDAVSEQSVS